jgi:hypothetical protein
MSETDVATLFFNAIHPNLTLDDDPAFWRTLVAVLADELGRRRAAKMKHTVWAMVVGACSHWVRPHNSGWWDATGNFVYPQGYKDSVPEFDWSVIFVLRNEEWTAVSKLPGKKIEVLRVAAPTRTARHRRATIHTRWTPNGNEVIYGFTKAADNWNCLATSDEESPRRLRPG